MVDLDSVSLLKPEPMDMHTVITNSGDGQGMGYAVATTMRLLLGHRMKQPGSAKPQCPSPKAASSEAGPYLRRAAGGEALIGDGGGWRLSGWGTSLIAVL